MTEPVTGPEKQVANLGKDKVEDQAFWYAVDLRTALNRTKTVFGTVEALNEFKAMDAIEDRCRKEHCSKVIRARLHRINKETGEKEDDACLLMDNVLPNGGLHATHKGPSAAEISHACEETSSPTHIHATEFGKGWGKAVAETPVARYRTKENDHAR